MNKADIAKLYAQTAGEEALEREQRASAPRCKACGAAIRWVVTYARDQRMPVDYDPHEDGNVVVYNHGRADVYRRHAARDPRHRDAPLLTPRDLPVRRRLPYQAGPATHGALLMPLLIDSPYLRFEEILVESPRKTPIWGVYSVHGFLLGQVRWFGRWRQFTFWPEPSTTFNVDCLTAIRAFTDELNAEHRATIAARRAGAA